MPCIERMTDKRTQAGADTGNMEKDPADWVTGDEPMTGAQKSYLKTLCEEAHVDFDENLTKAEASRRIDELQQQDRPRPRRAGATDEPANPRQRRHVGRQSDGVDRSRLRRRRCRWPGRARRRARAHITAPSDQGTNSFWP